MKKEYLKLVRLIHPDKLSADYSTEQRVLSEAVFIVVSDAFTLYRKQFDL